MENNELILLAGGTGFVGKHLVRELEKEYPVRILTRDQKKQDGLRSFYWNPEDEKLDEKALIGVTIIINLCGAGIADKRWTSRRKKELETSRIKPAEFLFSKVHLMPDLKQYISASGVNCYPSDQGDQIFQETDEFGPDFVSQLVKKWETAADLFENKCSVLKLRCGFVFAPGEGGLKKMEKPISYGFGSVLGSGKQMIPWIHLHDLIRMIRFSIERQLKGSYHAVAENISNKELTDRLAEKLHRKILLPNTPGFVLRLLFGELSDLLLNGIRVSNQKIKNEGFRFEMGPEKIFEKLEN